MKAFTPDSCRVAALVAAALLAVLLGGLAILRMHSRARALALAWTLVAASTIFAERVTSCEPPGFRMLAIIGLLLYSLKAVVGVVSPARLSRLRWLAFAAFWPGMRPELFATLPSSPRAGAARLALRGFAALAAGCALLLLARVAWRATGSELLATALVLPALSLILHFGLFNLAAAVWRAAGVAAEPLFRAPFLSRSLREFWGRRWNLAFVEMTAAAVYRPVSSLAGRRLGLAASFLFSGVLHELAISLPVRAGYGLPLLYFALQGGAVLAEGALEKRRAPMSRRWWNGHVWTIAWLVLPLPILFHGAFLHGVVWPLAGLTRP